MLTVLVGAWGGIVPFVGPIMGFNADASASWHWDLVHALLWAAPGALCVVFGLALLARIPRSLGGRARAGSALIGLVVLV